jgi:hypothetical protein
MPGILETGRLKALSQELQPGSGPCPFVVGDDAADLVELSHFSGGRDATYVVVFGKQPHKAGPDCFPVTIRYASTVESTAIIYDAINASMQGKARPFVCHVATQLPRVFAVMPYQIEEIAFNDQPVRSDENVHVSFLDARRQVIQAALPLELRSLDGEGNVLLIRHSTTNRRGRCQLPPVSNSASVQKIAVRSLLTGQEASIALGSSN